MAQIGEFSFVLAATGFVNGAVDADAYRLAIAVIAISLLVSPVWMISVRRFHRVAEDGISNFRTALAEVYAAEIEEFERGRAAVSRAVAFGARQFKALLIVVKRRRGLERRSKPADAAANAQPAPADKNEASGV
jgi:CPA2 family monovalent cation:H+ antiporter-2